jgi:hypothetical protein
MFSVLSFIGFLHECSDVAERAKLYPHGNHSRSNAGIAQGAHFHDTLAAIHGLQAKRIARMRTQFSQARR